MSKKFDELEARKQLLMMKAQLERMEFGGQVFALKKQFAWFNVFTKLGRWISLRTLPALASTALLGFSRPVSKVVLKAGLAGLVLAVGVSWLKARGRRAASGSSESTNPSES